MAKAAATLAEAGVASPSVDAGILAEQAFGIDRLALSFADAPQEPAQLRRFEQMVARRAQREPLQHILGYAPFYGLEFSVGPGVFIPRPETESLVEMAVQAARRAIAAGVAHPVIVDACAGSGAVGVTLAHQVPEARVVCIELHDEALVFLERNASRLAPVEIVQADATDVGVLDAVLPQRECVDVFVSNPPYVPVGQATDVETATDPATAVFASDGGMAIIDPLVQVAATWLKPGGFFAVEHDDSTQSRVVEAVRSGGCFVDVRGCSDLAGRPRFVAASKIV
ncbi:peptide chain release factor N(5)-glutamine methyltransferase [Corynebacterium aquilae]|uniref:peptide chain release factor N(5)-glutamine methyltransferase n=1 Tax=Corynebacterium aquilae TaxID=203263 RepID=UPI000B110074|nr:peptide chain release factor N(5)-glutamine methyltransferase [Corynebacterium aquilae]